eukprot:3744434-Pleurochrysis_carterae.AAC.2
MKSALALVRARMQDRARWVPRRRRHVESQEQPQVMAERLGALGLPLTPSAISTYIDVPTGAHTRADPQPHT